MSFPGLCNKHDSQIFSPLESYDTDYYELDIQILASVRCVFHELRKKEVVINWYNCMLASHLMPYDKSLSISYIRDMMVLGVRDLSHYAKQLNDEFRRIKNTHYFLTRELVFLPVVASGVFSTESASSLNIDALINPNWQNQPLNSVYFSLFPLKNKSVLIMGFSLDNLKNLEITERIKNFDNEQLKKLISDVLIQRIESWAITEEFYLNNIKPRESTIIDLFSKDYGEFAAISSESFNLFISK